MAEKRNYSKRPNSPEPIPANEFGKLPPQAPELEEAVIGALMIEAEAFQKVCEVLKPQCFYKVTNQKIYAAICSLSDRNEPTDMHMVVEELRKNGTIDDVGGPYHITMLTAKVSSAAHIEFHSRIIQQKYMARELIRVSSLIQSRAFDDKTDVDDLLTEAESMFDDIVNFTTKTGELVHISKTLDDVQKAFEDRIDKAANGGATGISTGIFEYNKVLGGGWMNSTLNVIAARPAMGKSALMLHFAKSAALQGEAVNMYSLEMSAISLTNRMILAEAYQNEELQIKADRFRLGYCNEREWAMFEAAKARLAELPIFIDDTPMVNTRYVKSRSKLMKKQNKCGIILIDYLQLADMDDENRTRNREQEVSKTTRNFKIISKELDVPIVLLSQLNRGVESRNDKKPMLSDLRESGAIEQDADTVSFIYRPAYYKIQETEDGKDTKNLGYIILAKQRDGASNVEIPFTHNDSMTKVWDYYEGGLPVEQADPFYPTTEYDVVPF